MSHWHQKSKKIIHFPLLTPDVSGERWNCKITEGGVQRGCISMLFLIGCTTVSRMYKQIPNLKITHMTRVDQFT